MRLREKPFFGAAGLCAALVALLLGAALLNPGVAILFRDVGTLTLPGKKLIADSLLQFGELPWWNPFSLCGAPFLADPANAVLFPLNFLFLLPLPLTYAFTWYLAVHLPLCFAGFWCCFRDRDIEPGTAGLLAVLATGAGAVVSCFYLTITLGAWAGVGWLFFFWRRYQEKGGMPALFLSSFFLAWPLYAGDAQMSYVLGLFFLPLATRAPSALAWFGRLAALGSLAILAASPQLLPTMDLIQDTIRSGRPGALADTEAWSLHPVRLIELFFGLPFGPSIYEESRIGAFTNGPDPVPFIFSIYGGALLLPLLGAALAKSRASLRWVALALFFVFVSMGAFSPLPLNRWLEALPVWGSFRFPERLFLYSHLACLLALASAFARAPLLPSKLLRWIIPAAILVGVMWLTGWPAPEGRTGALVSLGILIGGVGACVAAIRSRIALGWALAVLAVLDLGLSLRPMVWAVPAKVADARWSPFLPLIDPDARGFTLENFPRFRNRDEGLLNRPLLARLLPEGNMAQKLTLHQYLALSMNTASAYGIGTPLGYVTLLNQKHEKFWEVMGPNEERAYSLKGTSLVGNMGGDGKAQLYANPAALPLFWFPPRVGFVRGPDEALREISGPDWRDRVVVEENSAENELIQPGSVSVRVTKRTYRDLELEVEWPAGEEGTRWLLWNETFDRFWKVSWLDSEPEIRPANFWAMAVPLRFPAQGGHASLRLEYANPLIPLGQVAFAVWLLLFFLAWRTKGFWAQKQGK